MKIIPLVGTVVSRSERKKIFLAMKLTVLFNCILCLHLSATVHSQTKVTLNLHQASLDQIFREIEKKTEFRFLFNDDVLNKEPKTDVVVMNAPVTEVLTVLLKKTSLDFKIRNENLVVIVTRAIELKGLPVHGTVLNSRGQPATGVSILEKGTHNGVYTNEKGEFNITVTDNNAVLVISSVGFISQEYAVNGNTSVSISLVEDFSKLNEVVVVGYGNTTKKTTTGAFQTINMKESQDLPVGQFTQKLEGKMAGVQINQMTGTPGAGIQVRIRGSASLSTGATPLYVVDGFPIVGDISNINPDEIETVTVLKDAASTSLYGSRAAFGVVMVTTKAGRAGQTNISVNAYRGVQKVPMKGRPDMMNGTEWAQFKQESYQDLGQPVPAVFQNPSQYGKGYDWYNAMLRTAPIGDYSITVNTNKEKFSSAVTASFFDQSGVMLNSNYRRYSLRANTVFRMTDNLRAGFNLAPSFTTSSAPATDGLFFGSGGLLYNALLTPPVVNWKNPDGTLPVAVTTPGITAFPTPNWVRSIQDIKNNTQANRLLSNAYLEFEPVKRLVFKSTINVDLGQTLYSSFQPSTAGRSFAAAPSAINANLFQSNNSYWSWLSENTVSYAKTMGEHSFDVLGGYSVQRYHMDYSTISGSDYPDDRIRTIAGALNKNPSTQDIQEWSLISYIARLSYNYKQKYFLGATFRRDGSSRFGDNSKWGNFPSISGAWVVSEEPFFDRFHSLSFLKFRASYGLIGNNNIGNYTQYASVSTSVNSPFSNNTESGSAVTSMPNPQLGWESTRELDLGVDLGLLKDRINVTYDYYNKRTTNLLFQIQVARESGFSNFQANVGNIQFWGHEFGLQTNNLIGKFKWSTNFNIAFGDNKVLALSTVSNRLYYYANSAETMTRVGGRIGQFWGLVQDGVYKDQTDYNNSPKAVNSRVGTIKFKDLNHDGSVSTADDGGDKTIVGNPFPKFIFGFTNTFSYKNFDFLVVCSGSYGNKIARMTDQGTANLDGVFNVLKEVKDRWRSPTQPGAGKYGTTMYNTGDERDLFHSRFIEDGSYLTIKNVTLGYTVPLSHSRAFRSIRVFASCQQAYVFTKYGGANPEIGMDSNGNPPNSLEQGLDFTAYPVPRTFTLGANISLK